MRVRQAVETELSDALCVYHLFQPEGQNPFIVSQVTWGSLYIQQRHVCSSIYRQIYVQNV